MNRQLASRMANGPMTVSGLRSAFKIATIENTCDGRATSCRKQQADMVACLVATGLVAFCPTTFTVARCGLAS